jgi:uncharacterized protein GlcG (DUF336 family)
MAGLDIPASVVERMLARARSQAEADGARLCITVVDAAGRLAGFLRMPEAFSISTDLSIDKAWTAAGMRLSTAELADVLASESDQVRNGLLRRPRLTDVPGGVPLFDAGVLVGAVGVSGGSTEQDIRAAEAAIGTYLEMAS